MPDQQPNLERQLAELRAEVAASRAENAELKRTIKIIAIVFGAILLVASVPILGVVVVAIAVVLALFVLIFGTIGAKLGIWTGRALRSRHRLTPAQARP